MKSNLSLAQASTEEVVLPERVQEALGSWSGSKGGLLALSVGVGLGVLAELLEEEVDDVVDPRADTTRSAARCVTAMISGEETLGGRRSRSSGRGYAASTGARRCGCRPTSTSLRDARAGGDGTDAGQRVDAPLRRTGEPVGSEVEAKQRSTSKSSVSRTFVERTRRALGELVGRRLDDVRPAVMMIDGLELRGARTWSLGITTEGVKISLGLWEGSTENATVATALLADLVERGLDPEQGIPFVVDGAKALSKAIRSVFGDASVQLCVRHKERNCHSQDRNDNAGPG